MDRLKVLILEDDCVIALHIQSLLKKLSCDVIGIADNYDDALDMASNKGLNLIIADIKIRGKLNGIETAKMLHNMYKCEVLFLTGNIDDQTLTDASHLQSLGYLIKPFKENELLVLIKMEISRYNEKLESSLQIDENHLYKIRENQLFYKHQEINLNESESKLFQLLIQHINNIVTYESIDKIIWNNEVVENKKREELIFSLKNKLSSLHIELEKDIGLCLKLD